jgi:hypothetical protein
VFGLRDDGSIRFLRAVSPTPQQIPAIADHTCRWVPRWPYRNGPLDADDAHDMVGWDNNSFSPPRVMACFGW